MSTEEAFYAGFLDEIEKISEKKKKPSAAETALEVASTGGAGVAGAGALGGFAGLMAKWRSQDRGKPRPKWSHPARKWGKRIAGGGMAVSIPASIYAIAKILKERDKK